MIATQNNKAAAAVPKTAQQVLGRSRDALAQMAGMGHTKLKLDRHIYGRRNLSDGARAMLELRAEPILKAKAKERLKTSTGGMHPQPKQNSAEAGEKGQTRDTIAKRAGVSHDTVGGCSFRYKRRKPAPSVRHSGRTKRLDYYCTHIGAEPLTAQI